MKINLTSHTATKFGYLLIGAVVWLANFIHAGSFGIYEDDYILVLPAIGRSFSELLSANWGYLVGWPQGRPVFWILTDTWIWLVYHLAGINALYFVAFLFQWLCAVLVFKFLLRFLPITSSLLGAIFFGLFPPDAGKQIIMHQAVFAFTLFCLLNFFSFFHERKYVFSCLLLFAIGLNYEPYLLASLGCGFLILEGTTGGKVWKKVLPPFIMTVTILITILLLRQWIGEARVVEVLGDPLGPISRGLSALFIGPLYLVVITLGRSTQALLYSSWDERMAWTVASGAVILFLISLAQGRKTGPLKVQTSSHRWLLAAGLVMMVAPYLYRFSADYYPPSLNIGRLSSLHQVSALGASLLLALLIQATLKWGKQWQGWVLTGWVIWITAFVPLGLRIQTSQYVKSAALQKQFWLDLVSQIGDWRPGDPIMIDLNSFETNQKDWRPGTEGFIAHWVTNYPNRCMNQLFVLPEAWPKKWPESPGVYAYDRGGKAWLEKDGLALMASYIHSREKPLILRPGRFLYFRWEKGRLVRSNQPIRASSQNFYPRKTEGNQHWLEPVYTPLGADLFERPRGMWRGFPKSKHYP